MFSFNIVLVHTFLLFNK